MRLEKKVFGKFTRGRKTLSLAESCTGGLIAERLTNVAGSSAYFLSDVIAYDNAAKTGILGVPKAIIKKYGAVSRQVACAMAEGARKILKADVALSTTGIAGPGGGSQAKPVGLVFIAVSTRQKTLVKKFLFKGTRLGIKKQAAETALKILAK
ncbi:MAG: nicotinamide-nucleotide amidohydrolase family protein [Candidatus Omnitrophica bacterium]|nr:nicotinamide-nucleotide amidohydrolase family protein [Candidatus Omnitrophota bacterium]MDE2215137.1 nicotinamide-nucleotide amidohydrolase family protein [Candidatus Omnitrophota bacterium]MDE2231491.1 nicotinamide-nucleotide amidohydrolase family protein [Candidatus Omnitrophota bacterium]